MSVLHRRGWGNELGSRWREEGAAQKHVPACLRGTEPRWEGQLKKKSKGERVGQDGERRLEGASKEVVGPKGTE